MSRLCKYMKNLFEITKVKHCPFLLLKQMLLCYDIAGRKEIRRLLQTLQCATSRHVSSHSTYRMCLLARTLLNYIFLTAPSRKEFITAQADIYSVQHRFPQQIQKHCPILLFYISISVLILISLYCQMFMM